MSIDVDSGFSLKSNGKQCIKCHKSVEKNQQKTKTNMFQSIHQKRVQTSTFVSKSHCTLLSRKDMDGHSIILQNAVRILKAIRE